MSDHHESEAAHHESAAHAPERDSPVHSAEAAALPAGLAATDARLDGRGNGPVRIAMLQRMQQTYGNRAVQRMMAVQRDPAPAAPADPQQAPAPPDLSGTAITRELPGHGDTGTGATATAAPPTTAPPSAPTAPHYTAGVTINPSAPAIARPRGELIADAHGRPGAMGWTTPFINVPDPAVAGTNLNITVNLTFQMELAAEYVDGRLSVLQDHENVHVEIAKKKADLHLKQELEAALNAMTAFSRTGYTAALQGAINKFISEEAKDSQTFDNVDYPRMVAAYRGVRVPLATLAAGSRGIRTMVGTLTAFNAGVRPTADEDRVVSLAQGVIGATGGVSATDLTPLQYNPGFKALAASAGSAADTYAERNAMIGPMPPDPNHPDQEMPRPPAIKEETRSALTQLKQSLGTFTWKGAPP
ncbi:MAG: DUF922 domain-containing Zn-dependent protease [Chloroflexota bacterium]|nr:DUF922 domain-containing Zn-dependent protease [Chloroflexota bacterium]